MFTDELYASGVDSAMKSTVRALQDTNKNAYMYKFDYRSETDNRSSYWMGELSPLFSLVLILRVVMGSPVLSIYLWCTTTMDLSLTKLKL